VRVRGEGGEKCGGGAGAHEGVADAVADEVVEEALLPKADFGLGGVDVDVDFFGRHFEEHEDDGEGSWREDVAVGFADGVKDEAIADEAVVYEDVDGVAV
jgi:hypothetical protein